MQVMMAVTIFPMSASLLPARVLNNTPVCRGLALVGLPRQRRVCPDAGTSVAISDTVSARLLGHNRSCASSPRWKLLGNRNHSNCLSHADPAPRTLIERHKDAQRTEFVVERAAIEFVRD